MKGSDNDADEELWYTKIAIHHVKYSPLFLLPRSKFKYNALFPLPSSSSSFSLLAEKINDAWRCYFCFILFFFFSLKSSFLFATTHQSVQCNLKKQKRNKNLRSSTRRAGQLVLCRRMTVKLAPLKIALHAAPALTDGLQIFVFFCFVFCFKNKRNG